MDVILRMTRDPPLDRSRFVGREVVHDQVNFFARPFLNRLVEVAEELRKIIAAMTPQALADDLAGGDVERCEQACDNVSTSVNAPPAEPTGSNPWRMQQSTRRYPANSPTTHG
nr:hypothetical protein [Posidoniimonas polymericola]